MKIDYVDNCVVLKSCCEKDKEDLTSLHEKMNKGGGSMFLETAERLAWEYKDSCGKTYYCSYGSDDLVEKIEIGKWGKNDS